MGIVEFTHTGPKVEIGAYSIRQLADGTLFIEHASGEGMQIRENGIDELETLIAEFYLANF